MAWMDVSHALFLIHWQCQSGTLRIEGDWRHNSAMGMEQRVQSYLLRRRE